MAPSPGTGEGWGGGLNVKPAAILSFPEGRRQKSNSPETQPPLATFSAPSTASIVASISSSPCVRLMNAASNCAGGR